MKNHNTLIADSGSTKTDWAFYSHDGTLVRVQTQGINPLMLDDDGLNRIFVEELLPALSGETVGTVRYYGAGCRGLQGNRMTAVLQRLFPQATVFVESDLLAAARALCGKTSGIACILGTGSNSCLYNGLEITANVSPLGFILGDEGSGAVLGRRLIGDVLKGQLPGFLCEDFRQTYPEASLESVITRVYRSPFPNRYLAGYVPFLKRHEAVPEVKSLLMEEFGRFFHRNVRMYGCENLPVHFTGSIAWHFSDTLIEAAQACGFIVGTILKAPFERLEPL